MGAYAVLISLAFIVVTAMYVTTPTCGEVVAQTAEVKSIMHVDILNQDNSKNGEINDKTVDNKDEDGDVHTHNMVCDCGTRAMFTFFEIVVLVAVAIVLIYMVAITCGHFRGFYLKSKKIKQNQQKLEKHKADEELDKKAVEKVLSEIQSGKYRYDNWPLNACG